jgi:sporulation protein YlmC with PRC-barrel domain
MRSATLKGMSVVSIAEGARLGRVDDLLIDTAERRVVALHCSDQGRRFIVPFQHVRNIGKDAITVESSQVTQIEGQGAQAPNTLRLDDFLKLKAVDESGTLVGTVSQLDIDAISGQLVSLDVHKGGVLGLGGTTTTVAAEQILAVGPEIVTVANIQAQPQT